jgi:hypothetical protein
MKVFKKNGGYFRVLSRAVRAPENKALEVFYLPIEMRVNAANLLRQSQRRMRGRLSFPSRVAHVADGDHKLSSKWPKRLEAI